MYFLKEQRVEIQQESATIVHIALVCAIQSRYPYYSGPYICGLEGGCRRPAASSGSSNTFCMASKSLFVVPGSIRKTVNNRVALRFIVYSYKCLQEQEAIPRGGPYKEDRSKDGEAEQCVDTETLSHRRKVIEKGLSQKAFLLSWYMQSHGVSHLKLLCHRFGPVSAVHALVQIAQEVRLAPVSSLTPSRPSPLVPGLDHEIHLKQGLVENPVVASTFQLVSEDSIYFGQPNPRVL
nr:hypothetical protein Iba_chr15dCG3800 [Ipomoea batatas]